VRGGVHGFVTAVLFGLAAADWDIELRPAFPAESWAELTARKHEQLRAEAIADTPDHGKLLEQLDRSALGFSRAKHHRFLRTDGTARGFLLYRADDCIGYVYVSASGHIGPLAVLQRDDMSDAFKAALDLAVESNSSHVSAFLPGVNEASLEIAIACGMRITLPMVLMSAKEFGDWQRYLPRNPGFM